MRKTFASPRRRFAVTISFFSTAPQLSDKNRFPYFLRTIPSDEYQAIAIVEIIKSFNWSYVSIVFEDSKYGDEAFDELKELFRANGICLADVETLPRDSRLAKIEDYYAKIHRLVQHQASFEGLGATGVVIFGSDQEVGDFMSAVRDLNHTDKFNWIGSDGWGARPLVYKGNKERVVEGAVTVQPLAEAISGFKEYFLSLTPEKNTRNPWFSEFWEDYFHCFLPNATQTPYNVKYNVTCSRQLRMRETDRKFSIEPQLQFVSDAVMAFAFALKNLKEKICKKQEHRGDSRDSCVERLAVSGPELLEELKVVRFIGLTGMDFQFTLKADGPPRYRILNFQRNADGRYTWEDVGNFSENRLILQHELLRFRGGGTQPSVSSCQPECPYHSRRRVNVGECRCWDCFECPRYSVVSSDKEHCVECKAGEKPSPDRNQCVEIELQFLNYGHPIAAAALTVASLGALGTSFTIAAFVRFRDTAVVKASGRELSFLLLLGILLCYSMTFVLCARPTNWMCGMQKLGVGFSFSVCYSALLIKTNRIERIFRAGRRTIKRPSFISPLSQVVMFCIAVCLQVAVLTVWVLLEPPKAVRHYPSRDKHQLVCASLLGYLYFIGLLHPLLLICVCTCYACLTHNIPEAFNESKHIGFTMYSTCVIWLGFVPCYFSTAAFIHVRIATLCFSISLSATVALVCLFGPKLYIILLRPEQNVRQSMLTAKRQQSTTARDNSVANNHCDQLLCTANSNSAAANAADHNTADISTQADVELVGLLQSPLYEAADSPVKAQCSTQTGSVYRSDCVTQTSLHSLQSVVFAAGDLGRRVYFLSENTEEIQL